MCGQRLDYTDAGLAGWDKQEVLITFLAGRGVGGGGGGGWAFPWKHGDSTQWERFIVWDG